MVSLRTSSGTISVSIILFVGTAGILSIASLASAFSPFCSSIERPPYFNVNKHLRWTELCVSSGSSSSRLETQDVSHRIIPRNAKSFYQYSTSCLSAGNNDKISATEMRRIEREVEAEAQARLDRERVKKALKESANLADNASSNTDMISASGEPLASKWSVALAAGSAAAVLSLATLHPPIFVSVCCFVVVAAYAAADPLDDDGIFAPLARILGRTTIKTTAKVAPKAKAAILAATTGLPEEIAMMRQRIRELEEENAQLKQYVRRRETVDEHLGAFSLDELRNMARRSGIVFTGKNKAQLFMSLWERGIIKIND